MEIDPAVHARLCKGAELMDEALRVSTDLTELNRKLVTYWSIATHMLPHLKTFPLLVLKGPMGTGKSECLGIVNRFSYNSRQFVMRGYTSAMVRDEMIACYEGTAVIEEADQGWKDDTSFEMMLSDRYQRSTGKTGVKQKSGKDEWSASAKPIFGATVLHRRIPFADAALDGRSIAIRFRSNFERDYIDSDQMPWICEGYAAIQGIMFRPIEVDRPQTIAPRIFNSYAPVIAASRVLCDNKFYDTLVERLAEETTELKQAQSLEPDGIVLRAVLDIVNSANPSYGNIRLSSVVDWASRNHNTRFAHRQVAGLARSIGLTVREIHGSAVIVPSVSDLVRACREVGYADEGELKEMHKKIPGWWNYVED